VSLALLVLASVATVNAPRSVWALPLGPLRLRVAALGAALAWSVLVPFASFADPLLDLVRISPATARMAEGLLLGVTGILLLAWPPPAAEPALAGIRAAAVPVAFPVLVTPALGLLAVSGATDRSSPVTLAVLAVALVTVPLLAIWLPGARGRRVLTGLRLVLSATLVPLGAALVVNGLFDI
jgi:small neutral amino acid transporter SnatA (MarC family)